MSLRNSLAATAACLFVAAGTPAFATTWAVNCSVSPGSNTTLTQLTGTLGANGTNPANFGSDPGGLTGTGSTSGAPDALGALIGTPSQNAETLTSQGFGVNFSGGDLVEITGICQQDVELYHEGAQITNDTGSTSAAYVSTDGIQGQLEVNGPSSVLINGITLGNPSGTFSFTSGSDNANLYLIEFGAAKVTNSEILNGPLNGVWATQGGEVFLQNTTVSGNGLSAAGQAMFGIRASNGSIITLGQTSATSPATATVSGNGAGVILTGSSTGTFGSATIANNTAVQIYLLRSSSLTLTSVTDSPQTTVTAPASAPTAIMLETAASLTTVAGQYACSGCASIGPVITGSNNNGALLVAGGSAAVMQATTLLANSGTIPLAEARSGSTISLAGGNILCNGTLNSGTCTPGSNALAVEADHVGVFLQEQPSTFGYASLVDQVGGGATIQMQATMDIGVGDLPSTSNPSIAWNTGNTTITAAQNSSLRLQGGVAITGSIHLSQGSNGFFNHANGGTNTITGSVTCPYTSLPASHVAGPTLITPNLTTSSSYTSTPSGTCLNF